MWCVEELPAADRGVLAFGILAVDEHVDRAGRLVGQGRLDAFVEIGRPKVDVLVELAAHRQQQTVKGDGVGHLRMADGAEENRVRLSQFRDDGIGKDLPRFLVALAAQIVIHELEFEFVFARGGV